MSHCQRISLLCVCTLSCEGGWGGGRGEETRGAPNNFLKLTDGSFPGLSWWCKSSWWLKLKQLKQICNTLSPLRLESPSSFLRWKTNFVPTFWMYREIFSSDEAIKCFSRKTVNILWRIFQSLNGNRHQHGARGQRLRLSYIWAWKKLAELAAPGSLLGIPKIVFWCCWD